VHVRLGRRVAEKVGEEALDQAVLADDLLGAGPSGLGQQRLLLLAAFDQPFGFEPLEHLAGGRTRHAEHLGDAGGEGGGAARQRVVLADREGEEVDGLQVLVDGVSRHRLNSNAACPPYEAAVSLAW
jgi:hypothetical protein